MSERGPEGSGPKRPGADKRGPIAWMANNHVASNLLMLVLIVGGLLMLKTNIKQEVFPEFDLDFVVINVAYPGASPSEVEQGVLLALEEAVRGVDGVKEVRATASEGVGVMTVELMLGTNADRALSDVKSAVDRVTSFPEDIERPVVSLAVLRREVVSVVVYGDQSEKALRELADQLREGLLDEEEITVVELAGVRPLEISVEVPKEELRRYGLTMDAIAAKISQASVEVPGGGVKTRAGEVLVRTTERRDRGVEFAGITVLSRPDGTEVKLGDIARIKDDFRETDQEAYFNGKRAAMIKVFRVGDQKPIEMSDVVKRYVETQRPRMPPGVKLAIWADMSEFYADRINLLLRNAAWGLVLVFLILGMFLELRLAFWVTLGIPISFCGALLFMPSMDASINMISLFAFIVTLGIVVDDAIVVGEAVYTKRTEGVPPLKAAIDGTREVGTPVIFAILTTLVAFAPMLFVPGPAGKFFRLIPLVVIAVLLISLVECLFVLPAHLAFLKVASDKGVLGWIHRRQQRFSRGVEWLIQHTYVPSVEVAVRRRYLTLAAALSILVMAVGAIAGGRVNFTFMPKVDGDVVTAELKMPFGTSVEDTRKLVQRMVGSAQQVLAENGGVDKARGIFSQVGASGAMRGGMGPPTGGSGGHVGEVAVFLVPVDDRPLDSGTFATKWRQAIGDVPGLESLKLTYSTGMHAGDPIDIELSHRDIGVLQAASAELASKLEQYAGLHDIDDGFSAGKEQLDLELKPAARSLGVTELDLARQVRSRFFGSEAVRQQRGRDEVRVYVRLPEEQRRSEYDIEQMLIQTPQGGEVPLTQAAEVTRGRAYTEIQRRDGRRIVNVTADLDTSVTNAGKVLKDVEKQILPGLVGSYPGLSYSLEGEQRQQRETLGSLGNGFAMALLVIFAILAVVFRSYIQPVIIMGVIPFGLVGAVVGHAIMGYDLSLMSLMGIVALSGVVVNDSLILIVAINERRQAGRNQHDAIVEGGARRFRPILLTSLTTFFGLVPMIVETSVQARFLIPMAISLGFGVLFATAITLVLVPAVYAIVDDARAGLQRAWRFAWGSPDAKHPSQIPGQ